MAVSSVSFTPDPMRLHAKRVAVVMHESVAEVRMVRGDQHNALDLPMFEALNAAAKAIAAAPKVRAVVICGAGPSFCAGLDLKALDVLCRVEHRHLFLERDDRGANYFQRTVLNWRNLTVPVVAALHGSVFGGGLQLAMGADLRVATPDARLSIMETRWGLVPDMGATVLFQGLVRDDRLRELMLTAAVLDGQAAQTAGLVTHVAADSHARALTIAHGLSEGSPRAVRAAKRLLNAMNAATDAQLLAAETDEQLLLLGGSDQQEAITAHGAHRPPQFEEP